MFKREKYLKKIGFDFKVHSVCAILGPRQVGKTTLAREFIKKNGLDKVRFFDLENPVDLARLENPMTTLSIDPEKLVIIDEVQMKPDLFPIIRVLVDNPEHKRKFLILGSASRDLIKQSSETLAGRIGYIELPPFTLEETNEVAKLWLRGGFPLSYLAKSEEESFWWRQNYIKTFLERDIPSLGFSIPPQQMRKFWLMLAHYHGQTFNASEISKSLGVSDHTARRYLDILVGTFMIRELTPWYENIQKRQVKKPKIYFRDSGILNALLNIKNKEDLETNPKLGAFWEGFALEEIIKIYDIGSEEAFFWATQADAELDLFVIRGGKRLGFEFKYADAPKITKSMRIAISDLKLDKLIIVYPGNQNFEMDQKIFAQGIESLNFDLEKK
ncbi:ATP-binding protein [Candidatus Babeliales bacterium]|nr:ATP-binding protein [Candidatus Babeliales bacterium]MCF7899121.1 ATP-binding protein [Candidatus Babeliales bacterium]